MTTFTHIWRWWARLIAGVNRSLSETTRISHSLAFNKVWRRLSMTQRSDSCGRVHDGSASEVPFPRLERVRLDLECDSEDRLTLAVRLVHARINDRKQMLHSSLCTSGVQSCYRCRLSKLRNGAPFYTLCGVPNCEFHCEARYEIPLRFQYILGYSSYNLVQFFIQFGTPLVKRKVPKSLS